MFYSLNEHQDKLLLQQVQSYENNVSQKTELYLKVFPKELEGIHVIWKLFQ